MHTVLGAGHSKSEMLGPVKECFEQCLRQMGKDDTIALNYKAFLLRQDAKEIDEPVGLTLLVQ